MANICGHQPLYCSKGSAIAALVPPPRTHRHRFGVLAPNSPHRATTVALAQDAAAQPAQVQPETASTGVGVPGVGNAHPTQAVPAPGAAQAPGALSLDGADGPIYDVLSTRCCRCDPLLWRADAHHRLHHAQR